MPPMIDDSPQFRDGFGGEGCPVAFTSHQSGRLWLLNSGIGELGTVDRNSGRFEPVSFCPGYAQGLSSLGTGAVVGLSRPRRGGTFAGLPLNERLTAKGVGPRCGFVVVDTTTGAAAPALTIHHTIDELCDVAVLPGCRRPEAAADDATVPDTNSTSRTTNEQAGADGQDTRN